MAFVLAAFLQPHAFRDLAAQILVPPGELRIANAREDFSIGHKVGGFVDECGEPGTLLLALWHAARLSAQALTSWADLDPGIRQRLAREGISTPAAWRALGRRRFQLWGVTRRVVAQLDELAQGAP